MANEQYEAYKLLGRYKKYLTRQQTKTLAGQIKHGNYNEAMNGLAKLLDRRWNNGKVLTGTGE